MTDIGEPVIDETAVFAGWHIPRDARAIQCAKCGVGYAKRAPATWPECKAYTCGRDRPGSECCTRAFVCAACGARNVGHAQAPEMD